MQIFVWILAVANTWALPHEDNHYSMAIHDPYPERRLLSLVSVIEILRARVIKQNEFN